MRGLWKVLFALGLIGFPGCATQEVEPLPPLPEVPNYIQVAHPVGYDLSDVRGIFLSKSAPPIESLKTCDAEGSKLRTLTKSIDEITQGVLEMVLADPVGYHWCFYSKILEIQNLLDGNALWSERQQKTLDAFLFLVPLARAFRKEYNDARYLRWTIKQYRKVSEWVFYRKVEMVPQMTQELLEGTSNPYSLWRKPAAAGSVLQKYGLTGKVGLAPAPELPADLQRNQPPASEEAPAAEGEQSLE